MKKIAKNLIFYFRSLISPWRGPQLKSLFRAFFHSMVYIFTMQKIILNWAPLHAFLNIGLDFGQTCFQKRWWNFLWCKIWVIIISKSAKFLVWRVYWMKNKCLLLSTFCSFQTPLTLLTYSALTAKHQNIFHWWNKSQHHQTYVNNL